MHFIIFVPRTLYQTFAQNVKYCCYYFVHAKFVSCSVGYNANGRRKQIYEQNLNVFDIKALIQQNMFFN